MRSVLFAAVLAFPQQDDEAARKVLQEANALFQAKKYGPALEKYEECLKLSSRLTSALFNGGLAAYLADKPARAAELWEQSRKQNPEDWKVMAKLVQAYQATGETAKRDAARKDLFEARGKLAAPEREKIDRYVRDQFTVGGLRVMAIEFFELSGERALRYRFSVLTPKGDKEDYFISLGSYEVTTQIAREQGTIGKDERMFHLDGYFDGGQTHKLYGMFPKEPSYEECRKAVEDLVKKAAEKK